ncbi:hypothetical protein B0H10DRAFT_1212047 [Mycena sp. CBHHK59/15]|nr:hypothetical protein B0H10DRAFT_1212047 [Mycena sp. CBHHK59/15]
MFSPPTLEQGLALLGKVPNLEDIADAAKALMLIVTTYLSQPGLPMDSLYLSEEPCLDLLRREPELHKMLKDAHMNKSYETIRNSRFVRKPKMSRDAQELLDDIRPLLTDFINSKEPLTAWSPYPPPTDPATFDHVKSLKILTLNERGQPLVILKDLGSFCDDPVLRHRIQKIFVRGKPTVLVNTSGSGKTRLLFEGLCREWALYFTCYQDTSHLGSYGLYRVSDETLPSDERFLRKLRTESADFLQQLEYNHLLAHRYFSDVLLAHLLIFRMFLEIVTEIGITEEHKSRWLLLQLHCELGVHLDIFDELTTALYETEDSYTQGNTADVMRDIRKMIGPEPHLFFVLDEAQAAADTLPCAFHPESKKQTTLLKIMQIWDTHIAEDILTYVIAGTEISTGDFGGYKDEGRLRWTSDTGAFDEPLLQERYLRRFLPPSFVKSESGEEFVRRVWYWAKGRHRYTATLVSELLEHGFQNPHRILDNYVIALSGFKPTDGHKYSQMETGSMVRQMDIQSTPYSSMQSPSDFVTWFMIQDTLYHYLTTKSHPPLFSNEKIQAVYHGRGRFVDGGMSKIAMDEPIVLAGAAVWMFRPPAKTKRGSRYHESPEIPHNYLTILQRDPPHTAKTFAKCLAFYFARALDSKPALSDIFTFSKPVLPWVKQSAELVEIHSTDDGGVRYSLVNGFELSVAALATTTGGTDEIVSWLQHEHRTPFCIPVDGNPDLIFVLRLADGSFVWVIVQATESASDGVDLLACLEEACLFRDEEHDPDLTYHNRALELLSALPCAAEPSKTGSPTVLRVLASFENQITLTQRTRKARPQACLSMEFFRKVTSAMSPPDIITGMVDSVLGKRKDGTVTGKGARRAKKRRNSFTVGPETAEVEAAVPSPVSTRVLRPRPVASTKDGGKAKASFRGPRK